MRVGILTYGLDRSPTGIGRYVGAMIDALAVLPDGPELVLLTTERADPDGRWDRLARVALPGCRTLPALMTWGNAVLSEVARRNRLDIIHDPNGIAPFFGPAHGVARVVTLFDACPYVSPETHNALDTWRYHHMLPRTAPRADVVLTISETSRRDLLRYLPLDPARLHVTSCGVAPRFAPVANPQMALAALGISQPYVLYLGGINARKNIATLLRAFARVRALVPALTLVIGGARQWRTSGLDALAAHLHLTDALVLPGYIDDNLLPALYSGAALFAFPSLYEGFGLPPLEAFACGTPVVTSATSSLPEVVGDAALCVDPTDDTALANAMLAILHDPVLRATLRARGLARAADFSWQRVAEATHNGYRLALRANRMEAA